MVRAGSRKISALVLDDLLKYIVQDGFGIIRILYVLGYTEDVATFADIVLDIFVVALISELGKFDSTERKRISTG